MVFPSLSCAGREGRSRAVVSARALLREVDSGELISSRGLITVESRLTFLSGLNSRSGSRRVSVVACFSFSTITK